MHIIMRATRCVCEDGWRVRVFEQGQCYEVCERLGVQLLRLGYARERDVRNDGNNYHGEIYMTRPDRKLARAAAPSIEPITLSEAKTFLRVDGSAEDTLLGDMIKAVRIAAEDATGKSLITQSWKITYADHAPCDVPLPYGPVQSVTSVKCFSEAGEETTMNAELYHVHPAGERLVLETVVSGHRIEVVYVAGFGDAATDVPMNIRQGMLIHLLHLYAQRDTIAAPEAALAIYGAVRDVRL